MCSRGMSQRSSKAPRGSALAVLIVVATIAACGAETRQQSPIGLRPGGGTTVSIAPAPSFILPAANLADQALPSFHAGRALAEQPWIRAPSTTDARDGLGPLYNARSCLGCHPKGGRGELPATSDRALFAAVVRLSLPGRDPIHGAIAEPTYGDQLQPRSTALSNLVGAPASADGDVAPEGSAHVTWIERRFAYPDGAEISLRRPKLELRQLNYGPLADGALLSLRNAPPLHGLGLLELIGEADIERLADPDDGNRDGISGRVNIAWDVETGRPRPGRFGWKASRAGVLIQVAAAFNADMGITNPLFASQPCTARQARCSDSVHGADDSGFEVSGDLLRLVVNFIRSIGVPQRRVPTHPHVLRGQRLFAASGCASCHTPHFRTERDERLPHLSEQSIWPYTDLLLHDMGPALADGRPDYGASGAEWRTAPLWGVGLSKAVNGNRFLLHDGRARTVEEAIVWHGGEAAASRVRFTELSGDERKALIAFVRSL